MARTQSADYGDRRRAMLDIAAELYARSGFHGTSIADLAEAWGISKSVVYHYFDSKEAILFEVMKDHMAELSLVADRAVPIAAPRERLREMTRGFMDLYADAASKHKVMINDLDKLPSTPRQQIMRDQRRLVELVRSALVELRPSLAGTPDRVNGLAMLFFGMINWTLTWYDPKGAITPHGIADMAVNLLVDGIDGTGPEA